MFAGPSARCLRSQKCRHRRCIRGRARLTGCIIGLKITFAWNRSTCTNSQALGEVMRPQAGVESRKWKKRGSAKGSEDNLRVKRGKIQLDIKERKKNICLSATVTVIVSRFWVSNNSDRGAKRHDCIYKWTSTRSLLAFWQLDYGAVKQKDVLSLWRKARETLPDWSFALQHRPDPCSTSASGQAGRWHHQGEAAVSKLPAIAASQTRGFRHEPSWSHYHNRAATVTFQPSDTHLSAWHYKGWICHSTNLRSYFFAKCVISLTSVERTWKKRDLTQKRFC